MPAPAGPSWHSLTPEDALRELRTSPNGLTAGDAGTRLGVHGQNVLLMAPPVPAWRILLDQFRSVVIALLAAAALVAWVTADVTDAVAIAAVLLLNAALGFVTEFRARRAIEALSSLAPRRAVVRRPNGAGSETTEIDAADLVPGDVIVVEAGSVVPADARLVTAAGLRVNEASLTGESVPVDKSRDPVDRHSTLAERTSLLFSGTAVVDGRGSAVVFATAMQTEIGRIGGLVSAVKPGRTPLERRLDQLGKRLVWLALGVAALVGAIEWWQGLPWDTILATSLALAVAAVPESLPAVATIALAVGVHRMARRQALVRRLPSVESLGSVTVVCTDKTGTLTAGEMMATRLWIGGHEHRVSGAGFLPDGAIEPAVAPAFELALTVGVLAGRGSVTFEDNEWRPHGDPTDVALLVLGKKGGRHRESLLAEWPEIDEVPFSSDLQLMATFHRRPAGDIIGCVKGAPGVVLERSTRWLGPGGQVNDLDVEARSSIENANRTLAGEGLRVIALAFSETGRTGPGALQGLTFLGLAGLIDPPAQGVRDTITRFRQAGIRTVMITGDQLLTARAVGLELGLLEDKDAVVPGRTVDEWDEAALRNEVRNVGAFSRVSPEAKLRIVAALQSWGDVVAVLGDGVNDAAALRQADVGVAMGRRGTDVAREAADVVLQNDWFPTIGAAIEEGRVIYGNIRKFVFYLFSCNFAEIGVLLVAGLAGFPLPLLPVQILWLNLVTDTFPALALALEPAEPDIMARPPRDPRGAMLSARFLRAIVFHGTTIAAVTLLAFWWSLPLGEAHASTMAFMTLALAQLFHLGNARSHAPVLALGQAHSNPWALAAVALVIALQVASVSVEALREILHTAPLGAREWLLAGSLAAVPAIVGQSLRMYHARKDGR